MRREDITLAVSHVGRVDSDDDPRQPTLSLLFDDDAETLARRLESEDGETLSASEIDVTVRLHADLQDPDATGVVAITNRITGEYVLECNTVVKTVIEFARAARRYGELTDDDALYCVELCAGADGGSETSATTTVAAHEKRTLLVYGESGELLREHSLIPSGVEI
ncbi:MAG: DUF5793 family protein [Halobacteriales archaeon]